MFAHRFSIATCAATFLLLVIGALVHATGSSLACPDWPLCYGQFLPPMVGGIFFEHSHRLAAATVGLLTVAQAVLLTWKRRSDRGLVAMGWTAVGLVVLQGVLGGVTVKLRLPLAVSTAHLGLSMFFFAFTILIAFRSRPEQAPDPDPDASKGRARDAAETAGASAAPAPAGAGASAAPAWAGARAWAAAAALIIYVQILLGAFVRHTGSGLACGFEVPLCRGALWPAAAGGPALLHMAHRLLGVLAAAVVIAAAVSARRATHSFKASGPGFVRAITVIAPTLVLLQLFLGVETVWTRISVPVVTLHFAVGAALLACTVSLFLSLGPLPRAAELRDLAALAKPRLSSLVLVTTAGGVWLAPGTIGAFRALLTVFATGLVVGGANALNCWAERDVDARMARTRNRPLPAGRLAPRTALLFGLALPLVGLPPLFLLVNPLTGALAALALLLYVLVYTPLKQRSPLALFVGAVPGAIPPLLGWTAVTGRLDLAGLALFAVMFVWQLPHFLAIALYLKDDYARGGLAVMPLALAHGERWSKVQIVLFSAILVPVTVLPHSLQITGRLYLFAAIVLGVGFVAWGLSGFRADAGPRWARGLFLGSLGYLTLLFAALALDVR